jgi:chromosome segregation ATPase
MTELENAQDRKIQQLEQQLAALQAERDKWHDRYMRRPVGFAEGKLEAEVERLEAEVYQRDKSLEGENKHLQQQLAALRAELVEMTGFRDEMVEVELALRSKVAERERVIDGLRRQLSDTRETVAALRSTGESDE